jgi:hypothetical protein
MDKNQINNTLVSVINALNTVEVKGRNNLAALSGSIYALEEFLRTINQEEQKEKTE